MAYRNLPMTDRLPQYLDLVEIKGMAGRGLVLEVDLSKNAPTFIIGMQSWGQIRRGPEDITIIAPGPASDPAAYEEGNPCH